MADRLAARVQQGHGDSVRFLVLTTGTPDTEKLVRSVTCLGHETRVVQYDVVGVDVPGVVEETRADATIYVGACDDFHNGAPVPSVDALCRMNRASPMIHICSDAADPPWHSLLESYHAAGAFRLQVAIDGVRSSPIGRFGRVALTPVDPSQYVERPWSERSVPCGFAGGGGARVDWIRPMIDRGALQWWNESGFAPYAELCEFYGRCQLVVNDARSGSGAARHVKGRFVEASLAGAVIVEPRDSPAREWFEPGVDFLEWGSVDEATEHARQASSRSAENEKMASRMRAGMLERHAAGPFWRGVLEQAGISC